MTFLTSSIRMLWICPHIVSNVEYVTYSQICCNKNLEARAILIVVYQVINIQSSCVIETLREKFFCWFYIMQYCVKFKFNCDLVI